jgi:undecaprenyl-diphosphatase
VAGDGIAFWLGHRYRRPIVARWPLGCYPALVARGEQFLHRHGGKSVFIARFTPGVRAIVPLLAGVLRMSVARFYALNALSALLWGPIHVLAGAAIGATLVLLGAVAGRLAFIAALLIVLLALVAWGTRLAVRHLPAVASRGEERLRRWALARDSAMRRPLLAVLDPSRRELPGLALLAAMLLASLWLFFGVLQDVLAGDPLVRANTAVFHFLESLRTDWVDRAMIAVSELGDLTVVAAVAFAALLWLAWRRNGRAALHLGAAVALASVFTWLMKVTLHVPRPYPVRSVWGWFAFPSGHSAANAALYGFLAILASWELARRWRLVVASVAALLVASIAFSRLYLGAHWLSDILAGLAFGIAWAAFLGLAYFRRPSAPVAAGGLCASVAATLLGVGAVHIEQWHAVDSLRYAPRERLETMTLSAWWAGRWAALPVRRVDLAGAIEAPITLQWAGGTAALVDELAAVGWSEPAAWSLRSTLAWLAPHVALARLPVLPQLEDGHPALLVLTRSLGRAAARERLVLRLWRSQVVLERAGGEPTRLLLGTVSEQRIAHPVWFLTTTPTLPDYNAPREALAAALFVHRLAARPAARPAEGWDGAVLLAAAAGTAVTGSRRSGAPR